jgi:hypothetical protein
MLHYKRMYALLRASCTREKQMIMRGAFVRVTRRRPTLCCSSVARRRPLQHSLQLHLYHPWRLTEAQSGVDLVLRFHEHKEAPFVSTRDSRVFVQVSYLHVFVEIEVLCAVWRHTSNSPRAAAGASNEAGPRKNRRNCTSTRVSERGVRSATTCVDHAKH